MAGRGICPVCGADTAPGQEYCLECGERLTGAPAVTAATIATRFPIVRQTWFVPGLVGLLVMGIAVAVAVVRLKPDHTNRLVATAPHVFATITTQIGRTVAFSSPAATAQAPQTTAPPKQRVVTSWPAGRQNGYTVVLVSLPSSGGRPQAIALARRALAGGLPQVGIIDSARFASLHPGYLVVFSGVYDTDAAARALLSQARARGFAAAYVRQVSR